MLSSSRWENVGKAAKPQARRTPSGAAFLWLHVTRRGTASPGISSGGGTGTPSGPSPPPLVRGSFPLYGDFGLPFGSHFLSSEILRFLDILCHCNTFCPVWQERMGWLFSESPRHHLLPGQRLHPWADRDLPPPRPGQIKTANGPPNPGGPCFFKISLRRTRPA